VSTRSPAAKYKLINHSQLIFTARRYAYIRAVLADGQCLTVRLSVLSIIFAYCIETADDIIKLFLVLVGQSSNLLSPSSSVLPIPRESPLRGRALNKRGFRKNCNFRPLFSCTEQDRRMVTMERLQEVTVTDQPVSVPLTFSDLERQNVKSPVFPADFRTYARTV